MLKDVATALEAEVKDLLLPADVNDQTKPVSTVESTTLVGAFPIKPALFIGRKKDRAFLKERLFREPGHPCNEGLSNRTIIRGWPGVGKTTLVSELIYDSEVIETFSFIFWATLDRKPNLYNLLNDWCRSTGIPLFQDWTLDDARSLLTTRLLKERALVVLDDVWDFAAANALTIGGPGCAILYTTRLPAVAEELAPRPGQDVYKLDELTEAESIELLHSLAPTIVDTHRQACLELVSAVERLPLALEIAGRQLQFRMNRGHSVEGFLQELRNDTAQLLSMRLPSRLASLLTDVKNPTVLSLLRKSTDLLDTETRKFFAGLGVVVAPKPVTFDLDCMAAVWDVPEPKAQLVANTLVDVGLLEYAGELFGQHRYQMHDLLVQHARTFFEE
jgi:hypothetical protein